MATSNIRIAGATYPDVPSVTLKDTSNNDVSFVLTSDATASADKIEQGYTAYVNGQKIVGTSTGGGGGAVVVTEETLPTGGVAKHITAVDISNDTVDADHLAQGYTAHDSEGNALVGTMTAPSGTISITQNGTTDVSAYEYANVNVEGGGGGGADGSLAVRFLDYDGTVVASYSAEDFANLSAMPSNPSHTGLTAQGWNWTLADAKEQVAEMGSCDIGQMYVTDDGKTRIYCHFEEGRLAPYFGIGVNGTVVVDWGDGSATDELTGTSLTTVKEVQHTYASEGDYVITLTVSSGSFSFAGTSNTSFILRKEKSTTANVHKVYTNAVQKIELGDSANIDSYAFTNCYSLSSITIPSGITSIGTGAFYNCYALSSVSIPSGVTSIGGSAFYYCYALSSVSIPSGVTSIGSSAFYSCRSLPSINIPSGVTRIDDNAFYNCCSLTSITIPSGVTSINNGAFNGCTSLPNIAIPSGVTSIGASAFNNCYALSSITMPSGVTRIGTSAFYGCYSMQSINIPSGVTRIDNYAFTSCSSLSSITIPSGITSIGTSTFSNCHSLSSINIPSGVTSINNYAFASCFCLPSITIPSGVTSIGNNAFSTCSGVSEYHVLPTTPPTLGTNAFDGIQPDGKIYVPSASLETYKTATNWSTYADYMVGE